MLAAADKEPGPPQGRGLGERVEQLDRGGLYWFWGEIQQRDHRPLLCRWERGGTRWLLRVADRGSGEGLGRAARPIRVQGSHCPGEGQGSRRLAIRRSEERRVGKERKSRGREQW